MSFENTFGWITFLIIVSITLLIVKKNPQTKNFLLLALILRAVCVILDEYVLNLPGSTRDAWTFEKFAFNYSQEYKLDIIFYLLNGDSFFLSKIISIFYTLLDRSPMMAKMFSVGFGTVLVFLVYRLVYIIWGSRAALKAGWFATLFPTLILYSAIIMREVYVVFFLTYGLIHSVNYINTFKIINFIKSFFGFLISALFHGPMIIGFFIFLLYLIFLILKKNNYFLHFQKKNLYLIIILPLLLMPFITFYLGYYSIPKIGNLKNFGDLSAGDQNKATSFEQRLIWKIHKSTRSTVFLSFNRTDRGAEYPEWTIPNDMTEIIYLTPIRMLYFLFAPFPWDIKSLKHLIGLLDAIFYIYLSLCIFNNRKNLHKNSIINFLIIILFMYVLAYSFGVGNFGTAVRHRLKFIIILIAIAAPKISKLRLSKKI